MQVEERPLLYDKDICWQYDIRQKNQQQDLIESGLTQEQVDGLKVSDFEFSQFTRELPVTLDLTEEQAVHLTALMDKMCFTREQEKQIRGRSTITFTEEQTEILEVLGFPVPKRINNPDYKRLFAQVRAFIERHEWLGNLSLYPTHYFLVHHKDTGQLAGVVIMDMPAAFAKFLGEDTRRIEKLISRGACISWSPPNMASALVTYSMRWMVKNTRRRVFTAYSDPEARELGTIYQACNFFYLGQSHGTTKKYMYPEGHPRYTGKWFSDRSFRTRSAYKRYAVELAIPWDDKWSEGSNMKWKKMPTIVEAQLRAKSKEQYDICNNRIVPTKHKYVYILGQNKKETRELRELFLKLNPKQPLPYPKER